MKNAEAKTPCSKIPKNHNKNKPQALLTTGAVTFFPTQVGEVLPPLSGYISETWDIWKNTAFGTWNRFRCRKKVGGAGGSKSASPHKSGNPPSLPMEAYLESQWPPLHRFHNWYWHFWKNRKSLWVNCLTKNLRFAQVQTNKETTAHRQKTPERKAQKNPGAKPSN